LNKNTTAFYISAFFVAKCYNSKKSKIYTFVSKTTSAKAIFVSLKNENFLSLLRGGDIL
jgi:hypothetical protein